MVLESAFFFQSRSYAYEHLPEFVPTFSTHAEPKERIARRRPDELGWMRYDELGQQVIMLREFKVQDFFQLQMVANNESNQLNSTE